MEGRRAIFLDRDGTLIEDPGYPKCPDQVRLLPGVVTALRQLRAAGFALVVISNQAGIGRGLITPAEASAVHERFVELFAAEGVSFDEVRYCPHAPAEGCACRKPSPVMIQESAARLGIDLAKSYMIGDKESDIEAGRRAGCAAIHFDTITWAEVVARFAASPCTTKST